jgi:hypothetical protein
MKTTRAATNIVMGATLTAGCSDTRQSVTAVAGAERD